MVETIGFIGFGLIGKGIAFLAVNSGYKVVISNSRGPDTLTEAVENLGGKLVASADTSENIVKNPDIELVVLSVPLKSLPRLLPSLGQFKDKVVIDTSNYYPARDGHIEDLDSHKLTTSEWIVNHFIDKAEDLKIVKAFHNQDAVHLLLNASKNPEKQTIFPIAGDNSSAKQIASSFIHKIGYKTIDAGSLKESWKIEPRSPIYYHVYFPPAPAGYSEKELQDYFKENPAPPLTEAKARDLINEATKIDPVGGRVSDVDGFWLEALEQLANDLDASLTKSLLHANEY